MTIDNLRLVLARLVAVWRVDTRAAELVSAAILGNVWGIWLLLPFHVFTSSDAYRPMAAVGSEYAWGVALVLVSLVQSGALVFEWRRVRFVGALLAAASYAFIAAMFAVGNLPGVGLPTYGVLALANFWVVRRLSR